MKKKVATVFWDEEWEEYRVELSGSPDASYHTDDYADAGGTALRMCGWPDNGFVVDKVPMKKRGSA